jgi:hypothetical protein
VALLLDIYFTSVFKQGRTKKTQWLHRMHDEHYDLAIIGRSNAWWNIDMNTINKECGINSINLANNHFSFYEMLLRLKRFYENGNTLDHLLIAVDYWQLFDDELELTPTVYDFLPYLDDPTTYQHLRERSKKWTVYKNIPFWRYSEFNFRWGVEEVFVSQFNMRESIFDNTGSHFTNNTFYGDSGWTQPPIESDTVHPDFINLVEFCRKNSIILHAFSSPMYNAKIDENEQVNSESLLDSIGVSYANYRGLFEDNIYFNDNHHLSIRGGKRFTAKLIAEIPKIVND